MGVQVLRAGGSSSLARAIPAWSAEVTAVRPVVQPLEFRGVIIDGGKEYFSVHGVKR